MEENYSTTITAVILHTSGEYSVKEFSKLKDYQSAVGGYVDIIHGKDFILYVNDSGILENLSQNKWCTFLKSKFSELFGDIVFVSVNSKGVEINLSAEHHEYIDMIHHEIIGMYS